MQQATPIGLGSARDIEVSFGAPVIGGRYRAQEEGKKCLKALLSVEHKDFFDPLLTHIRLVKIT
jgi:hypothetical protein